MTRHILMVAHPRRPDAVAAAHEVALNLAGHGIAVRFLRDESFSVTPPSHPMITAVDAHGVRGCELVIVLGGDGTILWAAEVARAAAIPLLGINLGHVGFLAEAEREDLGVVAERVIARDYTVEERLTLDVTVSLDGQVLTRTWALNELAVEKAARHRLLVLETLIDGEPLATNGGDGIVVATPTGSTAYAFSAGGPVIWPGVQAILVVPVSAHALFSRPLVLSPSSVVSIAVPPHEENHGIVTCDGRRMSELPLGARVDVCASPTPVRFARLATGTFTDRLVAKFDLSVQGWRAGGQHRPQPPGCGPVTGEVGAHAG